MIHHALSLGKSSVDTQSPSGSAARKPCSSVEMVQMMTPTEEEELPVPPPLEKGIIRSNTQYLVLSTWERTVSSGLMHGI